MSLEGRPMLWHFLERVKKSKLIDGIVIATTKEKRDEAVCDFAERHNYHFFRGSERDVLDRFYSAAKEFKADAIVRVTPDCPLICPEVIDKIISEYLKGGHDYVTNTLIYTYPEGCDVEVFSFKALERAWQEAKDVSDRENVTPFLRNSGYFRLKNVESEEPVDPNKHKWSVDKIEDFKFVSQIYSHLYKKDRAFRLKEIIELLKKHPEIQKINSMSIVNEGYYKGFLNSPLIRPSNLNIRKSLELKKKAEKIIPGCSQTFSKSPTQFVQGVSPVFLEKAYGSYVWDVDGNKFIDYAMALGPIILGHNYPAVSDEVRAASKYGNTFTLPHRLEVELAGLICEVMPYLEMVRFGKNGSDVTSGAVRVARAFTGRDKVACCGYHGWQDWYVGVTTMNRGVPEAVRKLTLTFEYNKIETLEKLFAQNPGEIACVIMEAVGVVEPQDGFLKKVREITRRNGALLIFDEVVTGFRLALGGAVEYFKVYPDLACFGKAMANGFPIAAIAGRRDIMKLFNEVFYSFTFGGEISSIVASLATIKELRKSNVIPFIWEQGRKIKDGYNVMSRELGLEERTKCIGLPPRTVITFKDLNGNDDYLLKSLFQQECLRRGILFTAGHNICFSHSNKDVDHTLRVYGTVLRAIKEAMQKNKVRRLIKGEPIKPVFRKA
jgi:glutamate-1-semialdehyde 2,1-aminomutase/spore coat polysaccharide biosynthesis protein SpsF